MVLSDNTTAIGCDLPKSDGEVATERQHGGATG